MASVREPAVAGTFYPADPERLLALVRDLLEEARSEAPQIPGRIKALVAPHAGYVYSGPTAAVAYAALGAGYERAVVLGPCHYAGTPFVAAAGVDFFRTPLGDVPVWPEGTAQALALPQVIASPPVHVQEHSLEVQLPFIQAVLGARAPVLPLAVGWADPGSVAGVIDALWGGPETLIVVSSDLSHYLPYRQAVAQDSATIEQILHAAAPLTGEQACGAHPLSGLLEVVRRRGLTAHLLDYRNSGDTAGDRGRVVGYAAIAFTQNDAR